MPALYSPHAFFREPLVRRVLLGTWRASLTPPLAVLPVPLSATIVPHCCACLCAWRATGSVCGWGVRVAACKQCGGWVIGR